MADTALLLQGPAWLYYDNSGLVQFGYTKDGIMLEVEPLTMDLVADQLGDTPARTILTGVKAQVKTNLAEFSLVNLKLVMANAVPLQDDVTSTKKKVSIRPLAGKTPTQRKFVIKPIDAATGVETTNKDLWVTIPKGCLIGPTSINFNHREQRVTPIVITCYPDVANASEVLFFGDETVVDANESGF